MLLLSAAQARSLEVSIRLGTFGPLVPFVLFVEASVTSGDRGQDYRHELGLRLNGLPGLGMVVLELVNRSWLLQAAAQPGSFGERLSLGVEYSPYIVLGKEVDYARESDGSIAKDEDGHWIREGTHWEAWFAGLNLKGCVSLLLEEAPDRVWHQLWFSDGIYAGLFEFYDNRFTLAPIEGGGLFDTTLYIPLWLSLGYGASFGL